MKLSLETKYRKYNEWNS